jgi:cytidylate kinase
MKRVIAIDGPSGAGKSTVARMIAERLGLPYLDTGAMYRAIGLLAFRRGIPLPIPDPAAVARLAESASIDLAASPQGTPPASMTVWLDGEDVSMAIREPRISLYASAVSAVPAVRRLLVARQREIARERGGVLEGRDIGTKVFPETPLKFFLTADERERARRRFEELRTRGSSDTYETVLAEMRRRDRDDSTRPDSPLACDDTYTFLESDGVSPEEIVRQILRKVEEMPPDSP